MKTFAFVLSIVASLGFISQPLQAAEKKISTPLSKASSAIIQILRPYGTKAGFSLRRADGTEVLTINGNNPMPPASVAKMFSTACSLWALGPEYQFETDFGYTGSIKNGVLEGDLVITGSGDPSYVIEDLKEDLEKIQVLYGIHEIKGNLIFDTHYFSSPTLSISDEFQGDNGRAFTAWLSPTPLDFNSFSVWASARDSVADIEILPRGVGSFKKIQNNMKLIPEGPTLMTVDYRPKEESIIVSGQIAKGAEPKAMYRSLEDPYVGFSQLFVRVWSELGGVWTTKKFQVSPTAVSNRKLFTHSSRALSRILMDINKLSTNFGADMVLLAAGAHLKGKPASLEESRAALHECFEHLDLASEKWNLENASGLSRKSAVKPSLLTQFLTKVKHQYFWPEYLSSLSILGRDGTTKKRLTSLAGRARLKTGTLKEVHTIAGYLFPNQGAEPLTMALFFHCPDCDIEKLNQAEDKVLSLLVEE